jgi:hypothetical protein
MREMKRKRQRGTDREERQGKKYRERDRLEETERRDIGGET